MYRIKSPKPDPNIPLIEGVPPEQQVNWVPIVNNPDIVADYSESVVDTLHKKNLLLLGEDRYLSTLMLRAFPKRKMLFVPKAICKTQVPAQFQVLLSQRRRWINSTIHNMFELVLVRELCGIFCFSMQFVIGLELFGTLTLPAAITFTTVVLMIGIVSLVAPSLHVEFPLTPLLLLAGILGLPAVLIAFTTRKMIYIWYMVIYLFALPVWNFVLPTYAWWHFDDFSWGQTRQVAGEKKGGDGHGHGEGAAEEVDPIQGIAKKRWAQWEHERRAALRARGEEDPVGRLIMLNPGQNVTSVVDIQKTIPMQKALKHVDSDVISTRSKRSKSDVTNRVSFAPEPVKEPREPIADSDTSSTESSPSPSPSKNPSITSSKESSKPPSITAPPVKGLQAAEPAKKPSLPTTTEQQKPAVPSTEKSQKKSSVDEKTSPSPSKAMSSPSRTQEAPVSSGSSTSVVVSSPHVNDPPSPRRASSMAASSVGPSPAPSSLLNAAPSSKAAQSVTSSLAASPASTKSGQVMASSPHVNDAPSRGSYAPSGSSSVAPSPSPRPNDPPSRASIVKALAAKLEGTPNMRTPSPNMEQSSRGISPLRVGSPSPRMESPSRGSARSTSPVSRFRSESVASYSATDFAGPVDAKSVANRLAAEANKDGKLRVFLPSHYAWLLRFYLIRTHAHTHAELKPSSIKIAPTPSKAAPASLSPQSPSNSKSL